MDELVKSLAVGGPAVGWVIATLLLMAVIALWRLNNSCLKQMIDQKDLHEKTLTAIAEARIRDAAALATTVERSTASMNDFGRVQEARNNLAERTVATLDKIGSSAESSREMFKAQAERMEKGIGENASLTRELLHIIRPSPPGGKN